MDMEFNNSSEVDSTLIYVNLVIFFLVILPSLFLSLLCALALILPGVLNKKIRLLLLNILIADIINFFSFNGYYLGWSIAHLIQTEDIACKICASLFIVANVQKFTASANYSLNVYIFIKYGEKKLKWYVVGPFAVASWIASVILGVNPFFDDSSVSSIDGYCTLNIDSLGFKIASSFIITLALIFLIFQLVCNTLTIVYIKRNVLEGDTAVKKAVAKILAYLSVASILSLIYTIVPIFSSFIPYDKVTFVIINNVLRRLLLLIPAIATPIVTIILLKPIRVAMKSMCKKVCCFWLPNNQVAPASVQ